MRRWLAGLLLVPLALEFLHAPPLPALLASAAVLVPLAALLGRATEEAAAHTGPLVGGLLDSTLGKAAELIIALAALRAGLHELVKASLAGSILGILLLILGACLLVGGLRHGLQQFAAQLAGISAPMMMLAVVLLLVPGLFTLGPTPVQGEAVEWMSVGLALVVAGLYALSLLATLRLPGTVTEHEHTAWPLRRAALVLAGATIGLLFMSEVLVGAVEPVVAATGIFAFFGGVVLVLLVESVAEHFVAVQAAHRNRMDSSLGIGYGSTLQIALAVMSILVFARLVPSRPLSLVFDVSELVALLGAALVSTLIALALAGRGDPACGLRWPGRGLFLLAMLAALRVPGQGTVCVSDPYRSARVSTRVPDTSSYRELPVSHSRLELGARTGWTSIGEADRPFGAAWASSQSIVRAAGTIGGGSDGRGSRRRADCPDTPARLARRRRTVDRAFSPRLRPSQ
jgi:Ca2+:H+ antiporter